VINVHLYLDNNQAFYSQANWSRLEMKPHERDKTRAKKKKKIKCDKTQIEKGENAIKR
jgi:hypothetical protein